MLMAQKPRPAVAPTVVVVVGGAEDGGVQIVTPVIPTLLLYHRIRSGEK